MSEEKVVANPLWRAPRIHGELQMLGIAISERTVSRTLRGIPRPPTQTWKTFLHNHIGQLVSIDFFYGADDHHEGASCSSCWNIVVAKCCISM